MSLGVTVTLPPPLPRNDMNMTPILPTVAAAVTSRASELQPPPLPLPPEPSPPPPPLPRPPEPVPPAFAIIDLLTGEDVRPTPTEHAAAWFRTLFTLYPWRRVQMHFGGPPHGDFMEGPPLMVHMLISSISAMGMLVLACSLRAQMPRRHLPRAPRIVEARPVLEAYGVLPLTAPEEDEEAALVPVMSGEVMMVPARGWRPGARLAFTELPAGEPVAVGERVGQPVDEDEHAPLAAPPETQLAHVEPPLARHVEET